MFVPCSPVQMVPAEVTHAVTSLQHWPVLGALSPASWTPGTCNGAESLCQSMAGSPTHSFSCLENLCWRCLFVMRFGVFVVSLWQTESLLVGCDDVAGNTRREKNKRCLCDTCKHTQRVLQ